MGFTKPIKSPCLLVRSYRTVSPLPRTARLPKQAMRPFGGMLSVALSLTSRPVDVIDHPALWSPDFPPATLSASKQHRQRSPHPLITTHKDEPRGQLAQPDASPIVRIYWQLLYLRDLCKTAIFQTLFKRRQFLN